MPHSRNQPLYFNASDQPVLGFLDVEKNYSEHSVSSELAKILFEESTPIRSASSWKNKNVYEGDYWVATLRRHVHHESFLGREYLMSADFDHQIVGIQWQPFVMKWPRGTPRHRGHVPDFFVRLREGDGRVVDVKRPDKIEKNTRQFEMTRSLCDAVGWGYEVFTGLTEPRLSNLTFLCGFRQDRYFPPLEHLPALLAAFTPATSLEAGVRRGRRITGLSKLAVQGHVLHLLWKQLLSVTLEAPLTLQSMVAANEEMNME